MMGRYTISDELTPKRREWLESLRVDGPRVYARKGRVAFDCRKNGWTEWAYVAPDGRIIPRSQAIREVGSETFQALWDADYHVCDGEEFITQAGLAALTKGEPHE